MRLIDWAEWHDAYADPDNPLARRLNVVQAQIRAGFEEIAFQAAERWAVGRHRYTGEPMRLEPGVRLWNAFRS